MAGGLGAEVFSGGCDSGAGTCAFTLTAAATAAVVDPKPAHAPFPAAAADPGLSAEEAGG